MPSMRRTTRLKNDGPTRKPSGDPPDRNPKKDPKKGKKGKKGKKAKSSDEDDEPQDPGDEPQDPGDEPQNPRDEPQDPRDEPQDPRDEPQDPGDDTHPGDEPEAMEVETAAPEVDTEPSANSAPSVGQPAPDAAIPSIEEADAVDPAIHDFAIGPDQVRLPELSERPDLPFFNLEGGFPPTPGDPTFDYVTPGPMLARLSPLPPFPGAAQSEDLSALTVPQLVERIREAADEMARRLQEEDLSRKPARARSRGDDNDEAENGGMKM